MEVMTVVLQHQRSSVQRGAWQRPSHAHIEAQAWGCGPAQPACPSSCLSSCSSCLPPKRALHPRRNPCLLRCAVPPVSRVAPRAEHIAPMHLRSSRYERNRPCLQMTRHKHQAWRRVPTRGGVRTSLQIAARPAADVTAAVAQSLTLVAAEKVTEEEALEVAQVPSHSPRLRSIELHNVRLRWCRTAAEKAGRHAQQETR